MSPLFAFPITLFIMAILALIAGIVVIRIQRTQPETWVTGAIWSVFSGSITTGFMVFALFIYVMDGALALAVGVALVGILMIALMTWLAVRG